ncbi:MAG: transposase [Verrucomicrobiales bacterium]|nr:transposase [Verrucomicrobiales bacterium]
MKNQKPDRNDSNHAPILPKSGDHDGWADEEARASTFADERLRKRFRRLLGEVHDHIGGGIPRACQDWAAVKADYRFLSNPKVSESGILAGHFEATRARFQAASGTVLILYDTTEFVFQRESAASFGLLTKARLGDGREIMVRGLLMHSGMALILDGVPLGLAAVQLRSRQRFKDANAHERGANPTRIPIEEKESHRWLENLRESGSLLGNPERQVHIGGRESDIYELFCTAQSEHMHFLVRTCVDRLVGEGGRTVAEAMEKPDGSGSHTLFFDGATAAWRRRGWTSAGGTCGFCLPLASRRDGRSWS